MAQPSRIEWCDSTWNPVRGCSKVSPGCKNCYAETFAERWRGIKGHPYEFGFDVRIVPDVLDAPLGWRKPRRIFVNSMSDLFHEAIEDDYIEKVFGVMLRAPQHIYQILTKRHKRMQELMEGRLNRFARCPHIWLGVSAENEQYGLPRIRALLGTPAKLRFVSCEPLLGPINLLNVIDGYEFFRRLNWVIVGGESGPGARQMQAEWAISLRDQCLAAGIPYFFKQWGGVNKKAAGRMLEGRTWDDMPQGF
jgi:protein gp37